MAKHRSFLRQTVQGLSDEQAALRTTASELCLGGIIKHVALVEQGWAQFIVHGPAAIGRTDHAAMEADAAGFLMLPGETLTGLLDRYDQVCRGTDELVATLRIVDVGVRRPELFHATALFDLSVPVFLLVVSVSAARRRPATIDGATTPNMLDTTSSNENQTPGAGALRQR